MAQTRHRFLSQITHKDHLTKKTATCGTLLSLLSLALVGAFLGGTLHANSVTASGEPSSLAFPAPSPSPIQLLLEESVSATDQVAAIDAALYLRDPFLVRNPENLLSGPLHRNTRIGIFVLNLALDPGETASDVEVNLIDSTNSHYDIPATAVIPVPGFSFMQVIFRLPDDLSEGDCIVRVRWHDQITNPGRLRIRRPKPKVAISPASVKIYLPDNCPVEFTITNTGPEGSILDYLVADDGALGGFLDVENVSGALPSGVSATIRVSVKPAFTTGLHSAVGSTFVLSVHTPKASNFIKTPVSVPIRDVGNVEQALLGGWAGSWSGTSFGPNAPGQAGPTAPVGGNWILNVQTVDIVNSTASGSLTWTGKDIYWTSTTLPDGTFVATPHDFIPNRTIEFGPSNATLTYSGFGNCNQGHRFHLTIDGAAGAPNPSDKFYGPWFSVQLNADLWTATTTGTGFHTRPYNPANFATVLNSGNVTGAKLR